MFDLVHKHKHVAQGILALITLPFAFFGVDYYFRRGDTDQTVATVAGNKISQAEFDDVLREQQQRMRQALGGNFDPAMLETPEVRYALLDQLVNQRLLENRARADRLRVSDTQLQQFIAGLPPFQEDGKFSADKYRQVLAAQNMSPLMFEQRVRGELVLVAAAGSDRERRHRRADIGAALSRTARAEAGGRCCADRRRAVREIGQGERRRHQGVLRQESHGVPDTRSRARSSTCCSTRTRLRRKSRSIRRS